MIVPIVITFDDIASQFNIDREQYLNMMDGIAKGLAISFARKLEETAQQELHQTRKRYIQNIRLIDTGRLTGTVLLDYSKDKLIQMIEEGASPFDIKKGLLRSPKVKIGKNGGKYITVPFRWGTPSAVAESDVFSAKLPDPVYQVAKKQDTNIMVSGGGSRSAGLKLDQIPKPFQIPQKRAEIYDVKGQTYAEYVHKNALYEGLIKQQDAVTGQNRYFSFRRVSENSDKNAFIHPGIEAHDLIGIALSKSNFNQESEVGMALDNELRKLGFS